MMTQLGITILLTAAVSGAAAPVPGGVPAHEAVSCNECHGPSQMSGAMLGRSAAGRCASCHEVGPARVGDAIDFHARARGRCLECHTFHEAGAVVTPFGTIAPAGTESVDPAHCATCHRADGSVGPLSEGHRAAAEMYHTDTALLAGQSLSDACLNCHASGSSSDWPIRTGPVRQAFDRHASHPLGVRVVPGAGDMRNHIRQEPDPRLPLFGDRIECQTCHSLTAANEDLLIPFTQKYGLCEGCHQHNGDGEADEADSPSPLFATMSRR